MIERAHGATSDPASAIGPADLLAVAQRIAAVKFEDSVMISFRAAIDESPLPGVFPVVEILCRDDFGNLILCDYKASAETRSALILYLSHDPFAFVIVAEGMRELFEQIAESGMAYRSLRRRYQRQIDQATDRFDPESCYGFQRFAKVGDGMPLFDSIEVSRLDSPGLVLHVPR